MRMEPYTRIVATLGPSSQDEETITRMVEAGMTVARLNFSHGSHDDHAARIAMVRSVSRQLGKPITILQDLQGPKMRIGRLAQGQIELKPGQTVSLTESEEIPVDGRPEGETLIPFDFPQFAQAVQPGSRVLMDDGHLELEVSRIEGDRVFARVILGGPLSSHKGVNLPGARLFIPGFTEKDRADLEFGLAQGVDAVAISFVRDADDITTVRDAIRQIAPDQVATPLIAKLERPEALQNLEAILSVADGVMVARGDLGVEMPPQSVPIAQKEIIQAANRHNRIVITATQMLDSMITNPRPTRAEASGVANAILDGTDAVMLSGETASGRYPVESVQMMQAIAREAESHFDAWGHKSNGNEETVNDDAISISRAARELAQDRNVAAIAVFTQSGHTALLMSKARPCVPILAFSPEERTYQRMGLLWGVIAFQVPYASEMETMIEIVEAGILSSTNITPGQQVVVISGFPVGLMRPPNFALLHTIGSRLG
jgi:pyruvate kinase